MRRFRLLPLCSIMFLGPLRRVYTSFILGVRCGTPARLFRAHPALRAAADQTEAQDASAEAEPPSILGDLLAEAARCVPGDNVALREIVDANFSRLTPEDMFNLQVKLSKREESSHAFAEAVANAVQVAIEKRMKAASEVVKELLNGGDIEMTSLQNSIRRCLREQESPLPILMVLQLNIQHAQADGEQDKVLALTHIFSVINEELEKKAPRVQGMLNRLMRIDAEAVRENILRHHLTPTVVAPAPEEDNAGEQGEPLKAALVTPRRLATAIAQLVEGINRQLKAALGEHDAARFETLEKVRVVAMEARLLIGEIYGEGEMNQFGADLTPAFTTLMSWKQQQKAAAANKAGDVEVATA